ncbi:MAG TPA: hypothetical protein VKU02_21570 [Gemmataceae bacterium]|nr:hypothetical protein [Gemmataceae bacterium]
MPPAQPRHCVQQLRGVLAAQEAAKRFGAHVRKQIEIGGQYLGRGRYVLPPGVRGALHFFATAGGLWGAIGTTLELQTTTVDKQKGEFALIHGMLGSGDFHLILKDATSYAQWLADGYFGTGDNVWREKQ